MKLWQTALLCAGSMAIGAAAWAQAAPVVWRWSDDFEALRAAPNSHKLLFENDHISLLEVTLQPGVQEPMHGHKYPSVFAYDAMQPARENTELGGQPVAGGRTYETGDFPACRTMGVQGPHALKITDTFPQHFYRLQFKEMEGRDVAAITRKHAR